MGGAGAAPGQNPQFGHGGGGGGAVYPHMYEPEFIDLPFGENWPVPTLEECMAKYVPYMPLALGDKRVEAERPPVSAGASKERAKFGKRTC